MDIDHQANSLNGDPQHNVALIMQEAMKDTSVSITTTIAKKVKEMCAVADQSNSEVTFQLMEAVVCFLQWFAGDFQSHSLINVANTQVWGEDLTWLTHLRSVLEKVFRSRKPLKAKFKLLFFQIFDLTLVLFGQRWTTKGDKEGKLVQLILSICQIELECALDYKLSQEALTANSENSTCSLGEDKQTSLSSSKPKLQTEEVRRKATTSTSSSSAGDGDSTESHEFDVSLVLITSTILQRAVQLLTDDTAEEMYPKPGNSGILWSELEPSSIQHIYQTLTSAYSILLTYFNLRQGTVQTDVDVACVELLEALMMEMDESIFTEEVNQIKEYLKSSGYDTEEREVGEEEKED